MKRFLEKNKVYFEVFSYLFLGTMGIVVSITQARIAGRELDIHESELRPIFRVDYEYLKLDSTDFNDTRLVRVSNEGKSIKDFKCSIKTFYRFEITTNYASKNYTRSIKLIPVPSFYRVTFNTNNASGKLLEAFDKGNNKDFFNTYMACSRVTAGNTFVFVDLISFFRCNYVDINNVKHEIYLNSDGREIEEDTYRNEVEAKVGQFRDSLFHNYDIDSAFIARNLLGK